MLREDNSGFVQFPATGKMINKLDSGKTFVYLVAFDTEDMTNTAYELSNLRLLMPGQFVSDDISIRNRVRKHQLSIDEMIDENIKDAEFDKVYFPNTNKRNLEKLMSIPMTTCICMGWSESTYEIKENIGLWSASFRDLSNEGRKLYYAIKKLHNNKEVRILTFNNI